MLTFEVSAIDITDHVHFRQQPAVLIERGTSDVYVVLTRSLLSEEPCFSRVTTGDFVRIPIEAYQTAQDSIPFLVAAAIQKGTELYERLNQFYGSYDAPTPEHVCRLYIGNQIDSVDKKVTFYFGVAFLEI